MARDPWLRAAGDLLLVIIVRDVFEALSESKNILLNNDDPAFDGHRCTPKSDC